MSFLCNYFRVSDCIKFYTIIAGKSVYKLYTKCYIAKWMVFERNYTGK